MARILLVDDDELIGGMLQKRLTRSGHEVLHARNGREALRLFDAQTVSLVLTDLAMPDVDGPTLILELQRLHPPVKIIVMSGNGQSNPADMPQSARPPAVACLLAKPFSGEQLLAAIQSALAPEK
jgi:two-component system cell cycle sensor histidine kinase/response regulator CckA